MAELKLEDIAKLAGVSRSTVSRVVNDDPNVSDATRQRVKEVISRTGYYPNIAARVLASQRSGMIGLVLPQSVSFFFTDPYYSFLTQGIAQACNQYEYTLALFLVESFEDEDKIFPRVTHTGLFDGILVQAGHHGDRLLDRLGRFGMPIVVIGRPSHMSNFSYVDVDNVSAGYNATSHLVRLRYNRIGTITGPLASTVGSDRLDGYRKALRKRVSGVDEALIIEGDFTEEGGYFAMRQLLHASPDAVFCASDLMAVGAMRTVREAGLKIPEDIAFVGFDDLPLAKRAEPQLTTVRQPIDQLGSEAVGILLDLINTGIEPPRRVILETDLIIRDSCGSHRWT